MLVFFFVFLGVLLGSNMIFSTGALYICIRNILLGQSVSFLNSVTGVWTTLLLNDKSSYPLLQSVTAYVCIFLVYMPLFLFFRQKYKKEKFSNFQFLYRPWKYAILGAVDLEGNFLIIKAYAYTDILSIQLLSCLTLPFVFLLSIFFLRSSFGFSHIIGSLLALGGLIFLIVEDYSQNYSVTGKNRAIGDILCVGSSFCYALSNVLTELFVKPRKKLHNDEGEMEEIFEVERDKVELIEEEEIDVDPLNSIECKSVEGEVESINGPPGFVEVVEEQTEVPPYIPVIENLAMMSFFAMIFATAQFFAVGWKTFSSDKIYWTNLDWCYQILFGITMLILYTLMPTLFIICSAVFANVSLLTVNIFGFFFNSVIFKEPVSQYIYVPIICIVTGLLIFNITEVISSPTLNRWNYSWKKPVLHFCKC